MRTTTALPSLALVGAIALGTAACGQDPDPTTGADTEQMDEEMDDEEMDDEQMDEEMDDSEA